MFLLVAALATLLNTNDAFSKCIGLNVEDVCVDCYYWFDKSTKRKGKLLEYFDFNDQEYQAVLNIFLCAGCH